MLIMQRKEKPLPVLARPELLEIGPPGKLSREAIPASSSLHVPPEPYLGSPGGPQVLI